MSHWAHLENSVNDAVGALLKMGTVEATVATMNMQLRSKLHILKAMINLNRDETDWGKAAIKDIERVGTLADTWRNIVAHVVFGPHKDGVKFFVIKAKGKLAFPNAERSEKDFLVVSREILDLSGRIKEIAAALTVKQRSLGDLLSDLPKEKRDEQGTRNYLGRLLPALQDLEPPTNEESPETRQEPEE